MRVRSRVRVLVDVTMSAAAFTRGLFPSHLFLRDATPLVDLLPYDITLAAASEEFLLQENLLARTAIAAMIAGRL